MQNALPIRHRNSSRLTQRQIIASSLLPQKSICSASARCPIRIAKSPSQHWKPVRMSYAKNPLPWTCHKPGCHLRIVAKRTRSPLRRLAIALEKRFCGHIAIGTVTSGARDVFPLTTEPNILSRSGWRKTADSLDSPSWKL